MYMSRAAPKHTTESLTLHLSITDVKLHSYFRFTLSGQQKYILVSKIIKKRYIKHS